MIFKQLKLDPIFFWYLLLEWMLVNIPENDPVDEADVGEPVGQVPQVHHVLTQSLLYNMGTDIRKQLRTCLARVKEKWFYKKIISKFVADVDVKHLKEIKFSNSIHM